MKRTASTNRNEQLLTAIEELTSALHSVLDPLQRLADEVAWAQWRATQQAEADRLQHAHLFEEK